MMRRNRFRLRRFLRPIRQLFCFKKADRFKIGSKTTWDEIEVGEVFGKSGCFNVYIKVSNTEVFKLDSDWSIIYIGESYTFSFHDNLYKLPLETQELYYVSDNILGIDVGITK